MDHLISQYPVTQEYLKRFSGNTGSTPQQVVVTTITAKGYLGVFNYFWHLKSDTIYLPVLDSSGWPLLPPLQILSMLAKSRRRMVVNSDFSTWEFGFLDALKSGFQIIFGAIGGALTVIRDGQFLRRLLAAPRVQGSGSITQRVIYLKTNLWLGIQAGGSVAHTGGVIKGFLGKGYNIEFASMEIPVALPDSKKLNFHSVSPQNVYVIPREFNHYRHNRHFIDNMSPFLGRARGFIYQRLSLGNFAGVILSRRHGLPLVMEYNGSEIWLANNWGTPLVFEKLAMKAEAVCLKHAHLVVTVSDVLRDELVMRGVEPERIVSYPNGVDIDQFSPDRYSAEEVAELRARYGIPKGSLVVTFVGTFGPWHGAEVFARTISAMSQEVPSWLRSKKLRFMFIGDGVRRSVVEELTAKPEINQYVTIAGLIDQNETPLHLAASDILVSPHVPNPDGSPFFGSPTKLFEYLAAGRPVIASDLNQIGEVMEGSPHIEDLKDLGEKPSSNASGVLVEPEDTKGFSKAIQFLAENREWREAAGSNARQRALDHYTWDHHVGAILEGFTRVQSLEAVSSPRRIRLLFNGLHSKTGGGLTYFRNILPLFAEEPDFEIHVCVHEDQKAFLPQDQKNITVHYLDFPQRFWRLQFREQFDVPRLARKIDADVTFSPSNYGPLLAPRSVVLLRNALSVAFVETRPMKLAYWALVYLGTFLSLLVSRRAITVSKYARITASGGLIGLFKNRLTVIPHGVSKNFSPLKKGAERESFLLAVSNIYVQKNLKNLIYALAVLHSDYPDLILKIVGHPVDMEYFTELKQVVALEKLNDNVEFLGEVPSETLVGLYRRCAVFVFPSTVETFGNPLVEAMACGAPIASSNTAAMPEVVGDAAVFFNPRDKQDMAQAIRRLLNDEALCQDLSRKAAQRAKNYSWRETARQTLQVLKNAASQQDY